MPHKLLISIPTKQRVRVLGRCLASLLAQTYQDYDLHIVNDSHEFPIEDNDVTKEWLERHRAVRQVWVERGLGVGQVYCHNQAMYDRPWNSYEYVLRLDDDVLMNVFAVRRMVKFLDHYRDVAAVSGLWFEDERNKNWFSDRDVPSAEQWENEFDLQGQVIDGVASNWAQRVFAYNRPLQFDGNAFETQHLYGPCMYRSEIARRAGGCPTIYSKGVCHGEETDFTNRIYRLGYKLAIIPSVTAQHLRSPGGIRSAGVEREQAIRMVDDPRRNERLTAMPGAYDRKIRVGLWSQHALYTGGGPFFYFKLWNSLAKCPDLEVYPVGEFMDLKRVKSRFGFDLKKPRKTPKQVDVMIRMGDDLNWFDVHRDKTIPQAVATAQFIFYPFGERPPEPGEFTHIITLSDFVVSEIRKKWRYDAQTIYPVVAPIPLLEKKNWIINIGRIDQWKGTLWLMERFAESKLGQEGWELHVAGATHGSAQQEYINQVKEFARETPGIVLHCDVPQDELNELYGHAKILWAAKGILAEPNLMQEAEHYGLTPLEAMTAGCVPLVYDLGGHRETVPEYWRWKTGPELIGLTKNIILRWEEMGEAVTWAFPELEKFTDETLFQEQWLKVIYQANAKAVVAERVGQVEMVDRKPVMVVLADSSRKKTGFSAVANQIVPGFVEAGFDVRWYAILDNIPALAGEFPWQHWPMQDIDMQGEKRLNFFLNQTKPDIIWALYDPGNLAMYLTFAEYGGQYRKANGAAVPTCVYFPVEGMPQERAHAMLVEHINKNRGRAFTWTENSAKAFMGQYPDLKLEWAYFGLDHAPFRRYSPEDRKAVRKLVGMDHDFWVGAFGVNKRTKQHDLLVYAAAYLRQTGRDEGIKFYLHTERDKPILQGYPLREMFEYYHVEDMFVCKPDTFQKRGGEWNGVEYDVDTVGMARRMTMPPSPAGRGFLFGHYDMVSRYNCLDLYFDCSSVEGWGLPVGEAMACGVPTVVVNDGLVRSEVYAEGGYFVDPSCDYDTWHTGVQLKLLNPIDIAETILLFKNDPKLREEYSQRGMACAAKYKWEDTRKTMVKACLELVGRA